MCDYTDPRADSDARRSDGVNPTVRYLFEHAWWLLWPLAWVLVSAFAGYLRHLSH